MTLVSPRELDVPQPTPDSTLWLSGNGHILDEHYPTPSIEELLLHWKGYNPTTDSMPAPGVYGVINHVLNSRSEHITGFASIDLCEVLRHTAESVMRIKGGFITDMDAVHSYGEAIGATQGDVVPIVQVLMNSDEVEPVGDYQEIKKIMKGWKQIGVYCVANTSTLPGCEVPTINFFRRYFDQCFEGILLPRNYDGQGPVTKGQAARFTLDTTVGIKPITAVHIDDAPHHNKSFIESFEDRPDTMAHSYMPAYRGNDIDLPANTRTGSSLESFVLANDLFNKSWKERDI